MQHTLNSDYHRPAKALIAVRLMLASLTLGCSGEVASNPDPSPRRASETTGPAAPQAAARDLCGEPLSLGSKVLEIGNNFQIAALRQSRDRILARSHSAWSLWDRQQGAVVARGTYDRWNADIDFVGDVVLVPSSAGYEVRSARDGALKGALALPRKIESAGFATDGSYAYTVGQRQLRVWDLTGKQLRFHERDPWAEHIYAAPNELRYPEGWPTKTIETLAVDTGEVHSSAPFEGDFLAWFRTGSHFITRSSSTGPDLLVRVYTKDAALVHTVSVPNMSTSWNAGGEGDLFWVEPGDRNWNAHVYRLGVTAPLLKFPGGSATSWKSPVAVFKDDATTISVLDLRSGEPKLVPQTVPAHDRGAATIDADADGRLVYSEGAVIHDAAQRGPEGRPRALGCPEVTHLVGWRERLATASTDGVTRLYSYRSGKPELIWKLTNVYVDYLAFMDDGHTLAVNGRENASSPTSLRTFDFDEHDHLESELHRPAMLQGGGAFRNAVFATSLGTRYALSACAKTAPLSMACIWHLFAFDGQELWRPARSFTGPLPLLSPRGLRTAIDGYTTPGVTDIVENAALKTQLSGIRPLLWLDEEHLVVGEDPEVDAPSIIDLSGVTVATFSAPTVGAMRLSSGGLLHDDDRVYRQRDGEALWSLQQIGRASTPDMRNLRTLVAGRFAFIDQGALYVEPITPAAE